MRFDSALFICFMIAFGIPLIIGIVKAFSDDSKKRKCPECGTPLEFDRWEPLPDNRGQYIHEKCEQCKKTYTKIKYKDIESKPQDPMDW